LNNPKNKEQLSQKIYRIFCHIYGEKYQDKIDVNTNMDDIEEWDSLSFLDLVMQIEDEFELEFDDEEATQMFQLGHIINIVFSKLNKTPHEDVANACCNIHSLNQSAKNSKNILILSGSSTREGLVDEKKGNSLAKKHFGDNWNWFNCSVSGLVAAESIQLLEQTSESWQGIVVIGISPIILAGCGVNEFERSANFKRFPFPSYRMESVLAKNGYTCSPTDEHTYLDSWVKDYIGERDISNLDYKPYMYPTLEPWKPEKFDDPESINRFYNNSIFNYTESIKINTQFFEEYLLWSNETNIPVIFIELTIHSLTAKYLEDIGGIMTTYKNVIDNFTKDKRFNYLNVLESAGITDSDFRDPAHIYRKREEFTNEILKGLKQYIHE
jgi:acyl carrier protein